jgi:hypothetical protein
MASVVALTELLTINTGGSPVTPDNPLPVSPINVQTEFRESFETYNTTTVWSETLGTGDIVQLDGNAASASYLVISKDPLTAGTETIVETRTAFTGPFETAVGLSMSQRVLGQETSMELISTGTSLPPIVDLAISSITQATTTLTVVTTAAHGLSVGQRIGIYGVTSDSRFNYPAIVVAAIVSTTSFTVTAGPGGTITSVTAGPYTSQGFVYYRPALGYAPEGMSEIFENATATTASLYLRSDSGDALSGGTVAGNQGTTIATTASVALATAAYTYAFIPTSEYKFLLQADRAQFFDAAVDTLVQPTGRLNRTTVVPSVTETYKLRFRCTNDDGITIPSAKIVSSAKSASTTATVTTSSAHGLSTGDFIVIYGNRDQTNFANLTTATAVASVINSTSFTIAYGASVTATTYGGMVARVQGGSIPAAFSAIAIQSATVASGELTLIGNATWTWLIGDYVNVYGCRVDATGADLGVDGVYKVANVSTTTLVLIPIGSTVLPSSFASTNCGGTVIKRTDTRISYARINQYLRERVEVLNKSDAFSGLPVTVNAGTITTVSTVSSISGGTINTQAANTYALQSSTNLASNATFTGTTQNIASATTSLTVYNTQLVIGVTHTAGLVPGQLYLDLGTETTSTAPTVFYQALAVPIPSNANWQQFAVPISTRYYRLRFVNGATAQTNFRLSSYLTYNGGGLSGQMAFPSNLQIPLSTTNLAISGVFTSATLDFGDTMSVYQSLNAIVFADQVSASNGLQIQVSRDGTNWRVAAQATVTASTYTTLNAGLFLRYARVVYTNGGVAQTSFALDVQAESQ